eukprot:1158119-Pelagomonas_calceolata.AAC.1
MQKQHELVPSGVSGAYDQTKQKKRNTAQAVKTLPTSIKEKRIPRAEALCVPFTKRKKRKKSLEIRRVTSSSPCLILVTRVERRLLKSTSGARKFFKRTGQNGHEDSKQAWWLYERQDQAL